MFCVILDCFFAEIRGIQQEYGTPKVARFVHLWYLKSFTIRKQRPRRHRKPRKKACPTLAPKVLLSP